MIFRKPYAILIKYFKLIHVFITVCMAYLIFTTYNLNHFLSEYMKTTMLQLGKGATDSMFNSYMFILPIILIIVSLIMLITMAKKDKPKTIYLLDIGTFSSLFALYTFLQNKFIYLEENIMSARDVRLMYDFSLILLLVQITLILPTLIRAIGFDIKKFDFKKDLLDMDIDDADNEEFEVSFSFDGNALKRTINKKIRGFKYAYVENKFLFRILGLFLLLIGIFSIFKKSGINNSILNMNEAFNAGGITMQVSDTFITQKDYNLKNVTSSAYIAVELNVKAATANTKLNTARMQLIVGNKIFYPKDGVVVDYFSDLGKVYVEDNLDTKNYKKYLIIYEIPNNLINDRMKFRYISVLDLKSPTYVSISLKSKKIDNEAKQEDANLKKEIILNTETLGNSKLQINSFDMKKDYTIYYKYCPLTGECYNSKEYIRPNLNSTIDKGLLKLDASLIRDENKLIPDLTNAFTILNKFGTIVYKVNGTTYKMRGNFVNVSPKKVKTPNVYYIEINKRMLNCDYAYLLLKIRNKEYKYIIKNI